jgi:anti-sigma B factor antagonist
MEIYTEERDGMTLIAVQGDIDGSTAPGMQEYIVPYLTANCRILLEVSQVAYMSSAGLRVLLLLYRRTKEVGGNLILMSVSSDIQEAMNATGFLKHFRLVDTLEEGIAALSA